MKKAALLLVITVSLISIISTVLIYIAPHLGWSVNTVVSGSMEPALKTGSLIISNPVEPEDIEVGDIIVFRPSYGSETMIAHRVIEVENSSALRFLTQGDANLNPDPFTVRGDNLVGRICFTASGLGGFISFIKTTAGFITLVVVPAVLLLAVYVYSVWRVLNSDEDEEPASQE